VSYLTSKQIKHIAYGAGFATVKFGIGTINTGHCGKFTILHIEYFRPTTACSSNSIGIVFMTLTFWALPFT
jgi:hypothetical protein